jgi:hypothetical protein
MRKVGGPIQWIDVPAEVTGARVIASSFFADDLVRRPETAKFADDEFFTGAIGGRNKVGVSLVFDRDLPVEVRHQKRARFARNFCDLWKEAGRCDVVHIKKYNGTMATPDFFGRFVIRCRFRLLSLRGTYVWGAPL